MSINPNIAAARAAAVAQANTGTELHDLGADSGFADVPDASPDAVEIGKHLGSIAAAERNIAAIRAEAARNARAAEIRRKHDGKVTDKAVAKLADDLVKEYEADRLAELRSLALERAGAHLRSVAAHEAREEMIAAGITAAPTRTQRREESYKVPESGVIGSRSINVQVPTPRPAPQRPRLYNAANKARIA